jgi:hypothetical protein
VSRDDGGEQPDGGARKYGRDERDHARDRSKSLPASAPQPLDSEPALFDAGMRGWYGKIGTHREIAATLFVTTRTVEVHLTHAYQKLGINSREQLPEALRP